MLRGSASHWLIIGSFLAGVAVLAGLGSVSVDLMSSMRAYIVGESLWSKGQKDALYHLGRYIQTHDERDHARFTAALAIPLGDQRARMELDRPNPDLGTVRQGFLEGGNHPDDVEDMIALYQRFRGVRFMADAIDIWVEADLQVAELNALASQIHAHVSAGDTHSASVNELLARLPELNRRLTALEQRFSAKLSEASRDAKGIVLTAMLFLAVLLGGGGVALMVGVMRWQLRSESALRDSHERWDMAADAAGIGVLDWQAESDDITLDARAASLYGLPAGEVRSSATQLARERIHPVDAARVRKVLNEAVAAAAPMTVRYAVQHPDRSEHQLELNAHVRNGHDGPHMIGIVRDISDDLRAAQLLLDKQAAERANQSKGEFLSRVSHELRTPLNAVLGFAELMQTDTSEPPSPGQSQRIQQILTSGRHLLELINDILELTSIDESGSLQPAKPIDLAPVLRAALRQVQAMAQAHKVTLECSLPESRLQVRADPQRLGQVLKHLLSNAIQYNRPEGQVSVSLAEDGTHTAITVRDTGVGLSEAQMAQLYQPFNRLGAEFSPVQGHGLGLAITQRLLDRMGGSLSVHSNVGVGTSFMVRLPAVAAAAGGAAAVPDHTATA